MVCGARWREPDGLDNRSSPRPALPVTLPTPMESVLAAIVVALCVMMLLRMALGERRRQRVDAVVLRLAASLRRFRHTVWHGRARRLDAANAADAAIRRARRADHLKVVPKPPRDTLH